VKDEPEAKGLFVLGFVKERTSMLVASAVMKKMGLPPPVAFNTDAVDALGEYMNTVVGLTTSSWDKEGLPIVFGPPTLMTQAQIQKMREYGQENYTITLSLSLGKVEFGIAFNQMIRRKLQGAKKVLVVDDSKDMRAVITDILGNAGFLVQTAEDGLKGVLAFKEFVPDVTVMDLVMPNMGGLEAMVAIREFAPEAAFIVLTSSGRTDEVVSAKAIGVCEYIMKPMHPDTLLKSVQRALEGVCPEQPVE